MNFWGYRYMVWLNSQSSFTVYCYIHSHTVHLWAALFAWGVQYLAQGHFDYQIRKTGIEPTTFWLKEACSTDYQQKRTISILFSISALSCWFFCLSSYIVSCSWFFSSQRDITLHSSFSFSSESSHRADRFSLDWCFSLSLLKSSAGRKPQSQGSFKSLFNFDLKRIIIHISYHTYYYTYNIQAGVHNI